MGSGRKAAEDGGVSTMDDVQQEKKDFVEGYLANAIRKATDGNVVGLAYSLYGAEEFVTIRYLNGYAINSCVTGDSLTALMEDVLKVL